MTNELRRTFCDIEVILNALPEEDRNKVPNKLRKFISENKLEDYESGISIEIPIDEQELHPDTETFIGMLYLNYWCKDEEEKARLKRKFIENEKKYQKELEEKFEVFKNDDNSNQVTEIVSDETETEENISRNVVEAEESQMIVYKESFIRRIINKIFSIFRRKEYGK